MVKLASGHVLGGGGGEDVRIECLAGVGNLPIKIVKISKDVIAFLFFF